MAQEPGDDELDDILDSALEAFDNAPKPKIATPAITPQRTQAPDEPYATEEAAPEISDEATKLFENALKSLGDLNFEDEKDEDVTEADMKMVEEFMNSLGNSIGSLGTASGNGGGEAPAPDVEKLVENIVGHLLSADVLKMPMNQMREAYKEWLPKNKEGLSKEEIERFEKQQGLVEDICAQYENGGGNGEIMELLSKMQETGPPPEEVMKRVSSEGEGSAQLDKVAESCGVQ